MPTRWPSAASAAARFTVTLDLPTPPLPDATAMTVVRPSVKNVGCSAGRPRPAELGHQAARCCSVIVAQDHLDALDPARGRRRRRR